MKRSWRLVLLIVIFVAGCTGSDHQPQPFYASAQPTGSLNMHFDGTINRALRHKITSEIMPYVDSHDGRPWQNIDVYLTVDTSKHNSIYSATSCGVNTASARIILASPDRLDTIAHELAHAHHGCAVLTDARIEEGIAIAVGFQYAIDHPSKVAQVASQPNPDVDSYDPPVYNRQGIGGGMDFDHNPDNSPDNPGELSSIRERLGGTAFLEFWHSHPGVLARLNSALYAKIHDVARLENKTFPQLTLPANWAEVTIQATEPDFQAVLLTNHVFDPRPVGNQILILGRNHSLEILLISRDQSGNERALENFDFVVSVSLEGNLIQQVSLNSGLHDDPYAGRVILQLPPASLGQAISVSARGINLADELTYTPKP